MKALRISLSVILVIYSLPAFLSGLDIYKGTEPDLSSEWIIILLFFALSLVLCAASIAELARKTR